MQHDLSKVNTMRRVERSKNGRTPDRLDSRNVDSSMISMTQSPKRKLVTTRHSMMPPPALNTTTTNLRKLELENYNLELELSYSEYVSSFAELILEKKILKDTEISFCNSIKSLHEDITSLQEKCKLLETRIKNVKALSHLSDYSDIVQYNVKNIKDKLEKYDFTNLLSQLSKSLSRFDILPCENIILPNTVEEVKEFMKVLKECYNVLQQISDPLKNDVLENFATEYMEFITVYNDSLFIKKIVEKKICNLQIAVLKIASHALSYDSSYDLMITK